MVLCRIMTSESLNFGIAAMWKHPVSETLNQMSLQSLFRQELPAIHVPGFAALAECQALLLAAEQFGFGFYQDVSPPISRLGLTQFEHSLADRRAYFESVDETAVTLARIFEKSFDPLSRFVELVRILTKFVPQFAFEDGFGAYHAGVLRKIEQGTPVHVDYAPWEAKGWAVSTVRAQLTWNVYLTTNEVDGRTTVFDKAWNESDEGMKIPGSYGYLDEVVAGCDRHTFCPRAGDLVIFNSQNFHAVEKSSAKRAAFGSFLGLAEGRSVSFWS